MDKKNSKKLKKLCFALLTVIILFSGCSKNVIIVKADDMPQTKKIEHIEGKGLNEYATIEIKPEVFFETKSKIRSAILTDNGRLYFGNENCEFYAVDIATKQMLWRYSSEVAVQTLPVIEDGKIIFNAGNNLYILDSENGNELHKVTYPTKNSSRVSRDKFAFNDSYVAVSNGVAYYAALNGDLLAVDMNKGEIIGTVSSESPGEVASGINFQNGKLYYADYSGSICCVDIQTRKMVFRTQIQDRIFAPLYTKDGKIYAAGRSCKMYCMDGNSGKVIWSSFSYDPTTWFSGGSVSIGDTLYACTSDEHTIVAFNKDNGEFLRLYPTETNAYTMPVLHGENIVVAATDVYSFNQSYIMEFDTRGHRKLWQAQLEDCVLSSPAIYQKVLYFGSDSGKVYSINLE